MSVACGRRPPGLRITIIRSVIAPCFSGPKMSVRGDSQVSAVLQAAQSGDRQAVTDLLPLVYAELHELARARLARHRPGQTLSPTALVHEVYLRVAGDSNVTWEGRQHFFFAAAHARCATSWSNRRDERPVRSRAAASGAGSSTRRAPFSSPRQTTYWRSTRRCDELEARDPLKAQIVLFRYFTGLTRDETATVLGLAERTLDRHWR